MEPDGKRRPARRSGAKLHSPRVAELAGRLSDRFDTRVKVDLGRSKGKITVEFATVEDLERIVELMDPRRAQTLVVAYVDKSICRHTLQCGIRRTRRAR